MNTILAILVAGQLTLDLINPVQETNQVNQVVVEIDDFIGIAVPYRDQTGEYGRKIPAENMSFFFIGYESFDMTTPIGQIKQTLEGDLLITKAELDSSAAAIGIIGTWNGGDNEVRTTVHAILTKVSAILGQPTAWRDTYYSNLISQILGE